MARRCYVPPTHPPVPLSSGREVGSPKPQAFKIQPHDFRFAPDLDLDKMNQLADGLEAAEKSAP